MPKVSASSSSGGGWSRRSNKGPLARSIVRDTVFIPLYGGIGSVAMPFARKERKWHISPDLDSKSVLALLMESGKSPPEVAVSP